MILIYGIYGVTILKLQDQPPIDQLSPLSAPTMIDDYSLAIYFNNAILSTVDLGGLSRNSFDFKSHEIYSLKNKTKTMISGAMKR